MNEIAVLTSGGLDSAILLADLAKSNKTQPIYVRSGLRWENEEISSLKSFIETINNPLISEIVTLSIDGSLTLNGTAVGGDVTTFDTYIRKTFVKKASSLTGNSTASFNAVTASAPSGLSETNEDDFIFFLNGQYMEHDALTIQQTGATFLLKVDTDSIGYFLETDDEIIAQGKFNA